MNARKTLDLNPESFYMHVQSGSVETGEQWESDYQDQLKKQDEEEIDTWQDPELVEVEKDENDGWIEKN